MTTPVRRVRLNPPAFALLLASLLCLALGAGTDSAAAAKPKKVKVRVTVVTKNQAALLKTGKLAVRVRATGKAKVRLSVGAKRRALAKGAVVRFAKKGTRVRKLSLTARGRTALGACGSPKVGVRATFRRGKRNASSTGRKRLGSDPNLCPLHVDVQNADRCDPIDTASCLLPFPNDYFTVADPTTPTGRRVALSALSVPRNTGGSPVDATEYNRNDGWSPNNTILVKVPGVSTQADLDRNGIVGQSDIGRYADSGQAIVVINAATGQRVPIWAELDMVPSSDSDRLLIIHPAVAFDYGARYVVALRHLTAPGGATVEPSPVFKAYRDGRTTDNADVEARRAHMESLFTSLGTAGISRADLYLAWDFTVGSEQSITGRLRAIRDDAFSKLGDTDLADGVVGGQAPVIHITASTNYTLCNATGNPVECDGRNESNYSFRRVEGTLEVPCYMDAPVAGIIPNPGGPCSPGSRLHYAPGADVPSQNGSAIYNAAFTCILPRSAAGAATPKTNAPALVFGHGLLGDNTQTEALRKFPAALDGVACGTSWIGMSSDDLTGFLPFLLQDLGKFPALADRSQQGMLDVLYLARTMAASPAQGGFGSKPEFQDGASTPILRSGEVGYLGISQGGIFGGAATSVAPDWKRAVLGVPGMGFSTLLTRSTQFNQFLPLVYANYTNPVERTIGISMLQGLWDRGETSGYVHRMTSQPFPNTPAHRVILQEAFGDHQVTNIQTETEARTIGAVLRVPSAGASPLTSSRSNVSVPFWGINQLPSSTFNQPGGYGGDAALFVLDTGPLRQEGGLWVGTNPNPLTNLAPKDAVQPAPSGSANDGLDPHEPTATSPAAQGLIIPFLTRASAGMVDPCLTPAPVEPFTTPYAGTPVTCTAPPVHTPGEGS